jgi:hypothetical protein
LPEVVAAAVVVAVAAVAAPVDLEQELDIR